MRIVDGWPPERSLGFCFQFLDSLGLFPLPDQSQVPAEVTHGSTF